MSQDESKANQEQQSEGGELRRRRRRHSHRQKDWGTRVENAKLIRNLLIMALFVVLIVIVWYVFVSRPQ